jgi:hypothetical protein
MSELKVSDYNTHDCHTMFSLFFVIVIKAVNHPYLKMLMSFLQCYIKKGNQRC